MRDGLEVTHRLHRLGNGDIDFKAFVEVLEAVTVAAISCPWRQPYTMARREVHGHLRWHAPLEVAVHLDLGNAATGLDLEAAGAREAGRERIGDPAPVWHALDPEHAVGAAARVARRLIVSRWSQLDGRGEAGAFIAIDHAADDDRRALEPQLDRGERAGPEAVDAHRPRRERLAPREQLVAALRQVREAERTVRVGLDLDRAADRIAAQADRGVRDLVRSVDDDAVDPHLTRDDDARVVGRHRHEAHLRRQEVRTGDADAVAPRGEAREHEAPVGPRRRRDDDHARGARAPPGRSGSRGRRGERAILAAALELAADLGAEDRRAGAVDDHAGQARTGNIEARELRAGPGTERRRPRSSGAGCRAARRAHLVADDQRDDERDHARARDVDPARPVRARRSRRRSLGRVLAVRTILAHHGEP